jgi:hypothetical protein
MRGTVVAVALLVAIALVAAGYFLGWYGIL